MKFYVGDPAASPADAFKLVPDRNLVTGLAELTRQLGPLTSLERDLLLIGASVFAADLAVKRGDRECVTRDIHLSIPVVNYHAIAARLNDLSNLLYLMSSDNWSFELRREDGEQERPQEWPAAHGKTLLFSGGLDSLAGAVTELEAGTELVAASHYTRNPVISASQDALFAYLEPLFPGRISRVRCRATGQKSKELEFPTDTDREATQRTRSFLFLIIGAIVARKRGTRELLLIAENGQMAIHLPLTAARIGAFSTHTAHPSVVHAIEQFLRSLLLFEIEITNPFLYQTKAECIRALLPTHEQALARSVSCWRSSRQAHSHCGDCIPCLIRRIALETNGISIPEYARDLLGEDILQLEGDDEGRRNLVELVEFVKWFAPEHGDAEIEASFPDLINEHFDRAQVVPMYRRFSVEALDVLGRYPGVRPLL